MIVAVLLIALVLRIVNLNQSLWLDEAINVNVAQALSFKRLVADYASGDFHPPLYHLILRAWFYIVNPTEIYARLPSVVFGVACVFIIYLIGKKLYDTKTGIIAALLLATSPLHIYYSQEARMYMMAAFFVCTSVYFFLSLLEKDRIYFWIGFIISTSLMMYVDYLPYFMIPVYIVFLALFRKKVRKTPIRSFIPAFILIIILVSPWFLFLPKQLNTGLSAAAASPSWANVVGDAQVKNLLLNPVKFTIGRISNDNNLTYVLLFTPVGLYVLLLFTLSLFRISVTRFFLWLWLFIPVVGAFVVAFFVPVFAYFRFIFVLPALYLIWASAINTINYHKLSRFLLIIALIINLASSSIYFINPKFQRENWRAATDYIRQQSVNNSIVIFESANTFAPFDYYNRSAIKAAGGLNGFSAKENEVKQNVQMLTQDVSQVFLFQYLSGITDPQGLLFQELTRNNFRNTQTKNFEGVGFVYEFTR